MKTTRHTLFGRADLDWDYREPPYWQRLAHMVSGFRQPRSSRAYKEAVIELQRQSAPATALLLPLLAIAALSLLARPRPEMDRVIDMVIIEVGPLTPLKPLPPLEPDDKPPVPEFNLALSAPAVSVPAELAASTEPAPPQAAPLPALSPAVMSAVPFKRATDASRGATARRALLTLGDGSQETEDAVMRALRWLKKNQLSDGSWNKNKVAMTSLALLTFLAHDERPGESAEFGQTVQRGLEYLLSVQNPSTGRLPGNYDHPIATYALCEAYAMTGNPNIKAAAEKALAPLLRGQHPTGGWTYNMDPSIDKETGTYRDDTSYMGWCAQALKAARLAGIKADGLDKACKLAVKGFKRNAAPGGGFGYTGPGSGGLTSVGALCLQLLGAGEENEARKALAVMKEWRPTFEPKGPAGSSLQYYCYYATQCLFHTGGKRWDAWNGEMKRLYVSSQQIERNASQDPQGRACDVGWWVNGDAHSDRPVMDTCLASLQLMVYYRYLKTTTAAAVSSEPEIVLSAAETNDIRVLVPIDL